MGSSWAGRARSAVAVVAAALLLTTGCQANRPSVQGPAGQQAGAAAPQGSPSTAAQPAELRVSPADGAAAVKPSQKVVVTATTGELGDVTVTDPDGTRLTGAKDAAGSWASTELLRPDTEYTITVKATGVDGSPSTTKSTFRTLTPKVTATYGILHDGVTVGVGMPVSIQFDSPVTTEAMRAEVERRVSVTTEPRQAGAWGWLDSRQLMWRPAAYWQPGTRVTVKAPLTGLQTGPEKWVANDDEASFTVGSSMVSTVDMKSHTMTVRRGGQVIRTIPVSTGKPGPLTETRYGTKVIIRKEGKVTMDSATVGIPKGDPDYYKIDTQWNLRVTWTGEYLHAAPWSVSAQGNSNVSHGCVNMSLANAKWMYENSKVGDVVRFTGSSRRFLPHEGIGVWMYDFAGWKAQSALG